MQLVVNLDQSLIWGGYLRCFFAIKLLFPPLFLEGSKKVHFTFKENSLLHLETRGPKLVFWYFCEGIPKFFWFSSGILLTLDRESMPERLHGGLVKKAKRECILALTCAFPAGDGVRTYLRYQWNDYDRFSWVKAKIRPTDIQGTSSLFYEWPDKVILKWKKRSEEKWDWAIPRWQSNSQSKFWNDIISEFHQEKNTNWI